MAHPTILQIVPELDTGGAELSAVEIATAVVEAGGRALVLSEGGRLVARLESSGGEFVPFAAASKNPARILWNANAIARIIQRENVHLVHARSRAPAWSAMMAARRTGKPFVTTVHGAHKEKSALKKAYNAIMARGDVVITNSRFTAATVKERYAVPDDRLRVIYRGIDPALVDPTGVTSDRTDALRTAWKIPPGAKVVLLPARVSPIKGHHTVVAAARALAERNALGDTIVVFAGDAQGRSDYLAGLHEAISSAGLTGNFRLPGFVSDIPAAIALAHVTLLTSTVPETFGRTVVEAGAMGCPVIASDLGAPPELLLSSAEQPENRTGWLVPPSDPARLADAIQAALSLSPSERTAMGQLARRHVLAHYTLSEMKRQTLAVYDQLIGSSLEAALLRATRPV